MKNVRRTLVLASCIGVVASCSPADIAAEKKAEAEATAKLNQYCDARSHALELLGADAGEAGAK